MTTTYETDEQTGEGWRMLLGDSCERLAEIGTDTIDLSVCSPPFASLFTYSPSERDLGNSSSRDEFLEHYGFIIREMLRVTRPGRLSAVHVQQLTTTKSTHGFVGLTDFRGQVISAHTDNGWIFHGECTVDKNPQALRHGQRVLTPSGWVPIESVAVGDTVIGSDGCATKVEGVWPQGTGPVFRVTFSDGAAVDCDEAHLWTVRNAADDRNGRWQTVRTGDLVAAGVRSPSGRTRYEIPMVGPVHFDVQSEPPLHPYIIGALIGDGSISQRASVGLTTQRAIADRVGTLLPAGHTIQEQSGTVKGNDTATFYIGHPDWHRNDVLDTLRQLGMQGTRAWEKRIPACYMMASVDERRELLAGLIDTDGTVKRSGTVVYGTTSEGLAADVVGVVRSLGGLAHVRCETDRPYTHRDEQLQGRPIFMVCIELDGEHLVTLPDKVARWRVSRRRWTRRIVSIEPVGSDQRTCITVAADDGLFVTEGYVVTHNSQAIRTKATSLMFQTLERDSASVRPALADYVLVFRKPGENAVAVKPECDRETWIEWARPIWPADPDDAGFDGVDPIDQACWYGIRETDTLNEAVAREDADERHICPLQLGLIERCVRLWSNRGETVLTPFGGIGSELFVATQWGRQAVGIELKRSYFDTAVDNLRSADMERSSQLDLG